MSRLDLIAQRIVRRRKLSSVTENREVFAGNVTIRADSITLVVENMSMSPQVSLSPELRMDPTFAPVINVIPAEVTPPAVNVQVAPTPVNVDVRPVIEPIINVAPAMTAPPAINVQVSPTPINVNVPESAPPMVIVSPKVEAPKVEVNLPPMQPTINVPEPLNMPEAAAGVKSPDRKITFKHDSRGNPVEATITDEGG
jgi:hypothetical protein